jgi:hypothetical protein
LDQETGTITYQGEAITPQDVRNRFSLDERYSLVLPALLDRARPTRTPWWQALRRVQALAALTRHAVTEPVERSGLVGERSLSERIYGGEYTGAARMLYDCFEYFSPQWVPADLREPEYVPSHSPNSRSAHSGQNTGSSSATLSRCPNRATLTRMTGRTRGDMGVQMRRQLATSRRRWVLGTLVAVIVVLAVGASQGLAGARGDGTDATAPIQSHNTLCGADTGKRFIGTARLHLSSDGTLTIKVKLNGADPATYRVYLYGPAPDCDIFNLRILGKFKVGLGGEGSKVFQLCCYSSGSYVVDPVNLDTRLDNDSLLVKL